MSQVEYLHRLRRVSLEPGHEGRVISFFDPFENSVGAGFYAKVGFPFAPFTNPFS